MSENKSARIVRLQELRNKYSLISSTTREEYNRKSSLLKDALDLVKPVIDEHGISYIETRWKTRVEDPIAEKMRPIQEMDALINSAYFDTAFPAGQDGMLRAGDVRLSVGSTLIESILESVTRPDNKSRKTKGDSH